MAFWFVVGFGPGEVAEAFSYVGGGGVVGVELASDLLGGVVDGVFDGGAGDVEGSGDIAEGFTGEPAFGAFALAWGEGGGLEEPVEGIALLDPLIGVPGVGVGAIGEVEDLFGREEGFASSGFASGVVGGFEVEDAVQPGEEGELISWFAGVGLELVDLVPGDGEGAGDEIGGAGFAGVALGAEVEVIEERGDTFVVVAS